jgi:Tfp pilus assembly PilM family ATPase
MINTVTKNYFNGQFVSYQVTYVNSDRVSSVPLDEANTDYQEIQQWISEGNTVIDNGE